MMYLFNILFFIAIGVAEGCFWHNAINIPKQKARLLHVPLVFIRCVWFFFVWTQTDESTTIALVMCYPMWHLGTLYTTRHLLNRNIYKAHFFDEASPSSTSIIDNMLNINFVERFIAFLFGTIIYFTWITLP